MDRIEGLLKGLGNERFLIAQMHREFDEEYAKLLLKLAASAARSDSIGRPPEAAE